MLRTATLLAVAAVLGDGRLLFVDTASGTIVREVRLPVAAAAVFAGPDGRVLLPAQGSDETVVVPPTGELERWKGRLFPLFFDEYDRVHIVLPEQLVTISYPDRLPVQRVRLDGVTRPWRSACSRDGSLVAVCAQPAERLLVLVAFRTGGRQVNVPLPAEPRALTVAPSGEWVALGLAGSTVTMIFLDEGRVRSGEPLDGEVTALAGTADGKRLLVGTASGERNALVTLRVSARSESGVRSRDTIRLAAPVDSLALAGDEVVAVTGGELLVLGRRGHQLAHKVAVGDARQVAVLPDAPATALPPWSESADETAPPPG